MNKKLDLETNKILSDSEELSLMTKGKAWLVVKQIFNQKIIELTDITRYDESDPVEIGLKVKVNKEVIKVLFDILGEVEGTVERHDNYQENIRKILKEDTIIKRY